MSRKQGRLFDPGQRTHVEHERERHLHLAGDPSDQLRLNRDGAGLVPGKADGWPVRLVKPHSAKKARMVGTDLGTVGRAMKRKWFDVEYVEFCAGPGMLLDEDTGEEVPGSPLQALGIAAPFDHYVFSDFSEPCVEALRARVGERPDVHILQGDANDPVHLERVCSLLNPKSLIIAYLDPAKPNLHFSTVEFLANRFRFIDFVINLPVSGIHRSLAAGGDDRPRLMLNHRNPTELLHPDVGRTADNIREHYNRELERLGLVHITRRSVKVVQTNSPLYDIVLASRNPKAVELWEKANREEPDPQLGFNFDVESPAS